MNCSKYSVNVYMRLICHMTSKYKFIVAAGVNN